MKLIALFLLLLVFLVATLSQSQQAEALLIPERCSVPVPLNCKGYTAANESIKLVLLNGASRGMNIKNITAESEAFNPVNGADSNHNCSLAFSERDKPLGPHEERTYTLNVSTEQGSKCSYHDTGRSRNRYELEIEYFWTDYPNRIHTSGAELMTSVPEDVRLETRGLTESDYVLFLSPALGVILLIAAVVCFLKKKAGLAQVLMLLFAITLILAALGYVGILDVY